MARALSPLLALYLLTQLALLPLVNRERRAAAQRAMAAAVASRDSLADRSWPRGAPAHGTHSANGFPSTVLELSRLEIP
jgi:hypothetical protein